jgi:hypothetical protein
MALHAGTARHQRLLAMDLLAFVWLKSICASHGERPQCGRKLGTQAMPNQQLAAWMIGTSSSIRSIWTGTSTAARSRYSAILSKSWEALVCLPAVRPSQRLPRTYTFRRPWHGGLPCAESSASAVSNRWFGRSFRACVPTVRKLHTGTIVVGKARLARWGLIGTGSRSEQLRHRSRSLWPNGSKHSMTYIQLVRLRTTRPYSLASRKN